LTAFSLAFGSKKFRELWSTIYGDLEVRS